MESAETQVVTDAGGSLQESCRVATETVVVQRFDSVLFHDQPD